jgi:hypothetical protein
MKMREVLFHFGLLVVLLAVADGIRRQQDDAPEKKGTVQIVSLGESELKAIRYHDDEAQTQVAVTRKDGEVQTWVEGAKRAKKKKNKEKAKAKKKEDPKRASKDTAGQDGGPDAAKGKDGGPTEEKSEVAEKAEPEDQPMKMRAFVGNKRAQTLVQDFSNLAADRVFANLEKDALADMGLDEPKGQLEIEGASKKHLFLVGDRAYGTDHTYLSTPDKKTVYLVNARLIRPLRDAPSRLMEKKLITIKDTDVVEATAQNSGGRSMALLHVGRHDPENAFWAQSESPDEKSATAETLMKAVFNANAHTWPQKGGVAADSEHALFLQVQLRSQAKAIGEIAFSRGPAFEGDADRTVYARTQQTRIWVPLQKARAKELLEATEELFGPAGPLP